MVAAWDRLATNFSKSVRNSDRVLGALKSGAAVRLHRLVRQLNPDPHEQLDAIVSALLRQQFGHEKVVRVGILLRLGESWNRTPVLIQRFDPGNKESGPWHAHCGIAPRPTAR